MRIARRPMALAVIVCLGLLTACSADDAAVDFAEESAEVVVAGDDVTAASVAASQAAFAASDVAFVAPPEGVGELADNSAEARVPLLVTGDEQALAAELDRLGTGTIVVASGHDLGGLANGRTVVEVDPAATTSEMDLPSLDVDDEPAPVTAVVDPEAADQAVAEVVRHNIEAAGGTAVEVPGGDPRATGDTIEAMKSAEGTHMVAAGSTFGSTEQFTSRSTTATTAPELPGGGQVAFPGRRMVAAYGSPGVPSLGILGEQDLDATVQRVKALAEDYQPLADEPVVPAFEIITTVASDSAGPDGDYSTEIDIETIRPWVQRAGQEGIYVILDLQPGTTDFLTQAKLYEDLLKEPHVGLALDPEWRLEDGQRHMEQIGSVSIDEVNATADWLAELTRENSLPQKVFILHQFKLGMIEDRQDLDTSHDELAPMIHADGNGTPEMKMATWDTLRADLPDGVWMAWKNFYDEDTPTFSPDQTYDIEPKPWFVSYQ